MELLSNLVITLVYSIGSKSVGHLLCNFRNSKQMSHQIFNHDLYQVLRQGFAKKVSNCFSILVKYLVNRPISV